MSMLSPLCPQFDDLPQTIPVFPLENAIVMPAVELPLNIFEPRYLRNRNLETNWATLERMSAPQLVNTMAALLPISTAEKQAILEAQQSARREDILLAALEMSIEGPSGVQKH